MSYGLIKETSLTEIANAIRDKKGTSEAYKPSQMAAAIRTIEVGIDTSDATAVAEEIFEGKTAYIGSGKVTGTFTIENELSNQGDLIAQLQSAVDGLPEAGSGTVETVCVVEIRTEDLAEISAVFTVYENGTRKPEVFHVEPAMGGNNIFSNVVIGSYIYITLGAYNEDMSIRLDDSFRVVEEFTFDSETTRIIVIEVNGSGSINFYSDEGI